MHENDRNNSHCCIFMSDDYRIVAAMVAFQREGVGGESKETGMVADTRRRVELGHEGVGVGVQNVEEVVVVLYIGYKMAHLWGRDRHHCMEFVALCGTDIGSEGG